MNPEQQRIAIAEACGWRLFSQFKNLWAPPRSVVEYDCDAYPLPNYPFDLNAMHEVESILNADQMVSYDYHLDRVVGNGRQGLNIEYFLWSATAAQRAEAFLRTIGKWEESK
jgi:hypothetical protein